MLNMCNPFSTIAPFMGIKLIDMVINAWRLV